MLRTQWNPFNNPCNSLVYLKAKGAGGTVIEKLLDLLQKWCLNCFMKYF